MMRLNGRRVSIGARRWWESFILVSFLLSETAANADGARVAHGPAVASLLDLLVCSVLTHPASLRFLSPLASILCILWPIIVDHNGCRTSISQAPDAEDCGKMDRRPVPAACPAQDLPLIACRASHSHTCGRACCSCIGE